MLEVKNLWLCVCLFGASKEVVLGYLLRSMTHLFPQGSEQMWPKAHHLLGSRPGPLSGRTASISRSLVISSSITLCMPILQMRLCAAF